MGFLLGTALIVKKLELENVIVSGAFVGEHDLYFGSFFGFVQAIEVIEVSGIVRSLVYLGDVARCPVGFDSDRNVNMS